ncbi:putative type IX secretion system sortase PorU2 [Hymenobacter tenuis]
MKQAYPKLRWLAFLLWIFSISVAQAQSGPFGNEWIVPGQQYYKVQVAQNGIYRLDYQYLQQAGISGVSPDRLQLWRRGKEVAIYVGGNQTALDATTYIEFFGQKNDAALDRGMYRLAADQPQPLYSMFTDTAAYFLTWSNAATGKRMAQSNPAASAPHPHRLNRAYQAYTNAFNVISDEDNIYHPWAEEGEGFLSADQALFFTQNGSSTPTVIKLNVRADSVWSVSTDATRMLLDIQLVGSSMGQHISEVSVVAPGGTRVLGTINFSNFGSGRGMFPLLPSDRTGSRIQLSITQKGSGLRAAWGDRCRVAFTRIIHPQTNRWLSKRRQVYFSNDSSLTGPAYFQLDSIPATVRGFDITDAYNVQRVEGNEGPSASQRGFGFASATDGRTRNLLLFDISQPLQPRPAKRVRFRSISPGAHNFLIVSHPVLMKPVGSVANPVRAYADYRASSQGGRWDTLVVTSQQLYDQFHYGEMSALAVRQFAQFMLTGSNRPQSLLLLGKGIGVSENNCGFIRTSPNTFGCNSANPVRNLVPASTRGISDAFFTANWQTNDFVARMNTGRLSTQTPTQVLNYLNKLKEHEALGYEPWRRNVLHMSGGRGAEEDGVFTSYVNTYAAYVQKPPFSGKVVKTYRRSDYPGTAPGDTPPLNLAADFNAGLSFISYFGHGGPHNLMWNIANINDATTGFANKGKYPVWYISGCSAGNSFRGPTSFGGEDYLLADSKGLIGFLSDSDLGFETDLHVMHTEMAKLLFSDAMWYGRPVAEVQREVTRRLQGNSPRPTARTAMLMNTIWQGDPELKLFSPDKPDFQTADNQLQVSPSLVPITARTFELKVGVSNPGRSTKGTLEIRVTRTYTSRPNEILLFSVPQARRDTTYTLTITNPTTGSSIAGLNTFTVELDPANKIDELDETNNRATLEYSFLTGGVTALSPPEFGIIGTTVVRLVGQSNVITTTAREYDMEVDTVQTFNSPLIQKTKLSAVMVPEWQVTLPTVGRDSVVWYWRLRLHAAQGDESPEWATSSFRVINGRSGGWSQSHPGQFRRDELSGIQVAVPGGQWSFNNNGQEATITSTRIGPAREWQSLFHTIRTTTSNSYTLRLIGIDESGNEVVLNPNITNRTESLSSVSAEKYPYLQLQAVLRTNGGGATPQLEQWLVTYQGVPEGVVRRDVVLATSPTAYDAATFAQQAQTGTITVPVSFQNVSDFDFTDPLVASILIRDNANRTVEKKVEFKGNPLLAHTQRTYEVKLNIIGLGGTLTGQVVMNPRVQPELYYFNNELALPPFELNSRDTPPTLDVAFDGRHLLNGDIVSPTPIITLQLRDVDKLRPMRDASSFIVAITRPLSTTSEPVDLNAAGITFVADSAQGTARLEYQPGKSTPLPDGVYTLEVQGRDGSGNLAGSEPYRITFEVISNSTITNVFPYPNPVTSKTKFVFTLTGSTLPRDMKIQIVTLTGRVVKEIMMADLGPLRIGNNMTEYAWDGTDTYGDRLANGTYLYRVILDDPEGKFKQRTTAGDKAFKKDWGKLVLLR